MTKAKEAIDRAFTNFWKRTYTLPDGRDVTLALLIREEDWRPLDASWWRGKQVSIIAADIAGNFFLRHADGSVRYWDHQVRIAEIVAPSVIEFCQRIR